VLPLVLIMLLPVLLIIGHSFAHQECLRAQQDFPGWRVECAYHDGQTTEQMLRELPQDLDNLPYTPDAVIVWIGTNDAEQHVPPVIWQRYAWTFYVTLSGRFPSAQIVWPNVCPLAFNTWQQYGDTRPYVLGYNRAVYWTATVDVWSMTKLDNNWADPSKICGIHPCNTKNDQEWPVIDAAISEVLQ
jgi:hypothetical protein